MKNFLIIPLGGLGKRFVESGYKTYKPFLKISKNLRVIDSIANNFPKKDTQIIIIGNQKKYKDIVSNFKRKNTFFLKIKNHKSGPLYSLFLAKKKLKKIIKDNNFFIAYSDINWRWDFKSVKKDLLKKDIVVYSHKGFHPHLEINSKSDFFLCNKKNEIISVSEKKKIHPDYKKNYLAVGCYYFRNFEYFEKFFIESNFKKQSKKKEIYIINLLNFCLKKKITINHFTINQFVHLGIPSQYEDFLNWKNILIHDFKKSMNLDYPSVMLMGGKGERVKNLKVKKPFLKIKNYKIYDYIFDKYGSKEKHVITNNNYLKLIDKKYNIFKINTTQSMLQTVEKSINFLTNKAEFFILSCDCFGFFEKLKFKKFIKKEKSDVVLFAFKISELQKTLFNAHSSIELKQKKIKSINIKKSLNNKNELGHAGFFWVKNRNIFNELVKFHLSNKLKREIILDDYFKYLFDKKLFNISCYKLNYYIHIGSIKEYEEMKYWENYFIDENR
jgi:molybdopterin-guanine dinucleotide biosynthesis protein A/choline kinase